jgi:hypothetical protein
LRTNTIFALPKTKQFLQTISAEVAHLVEHDLAKVGVAGSSPVFRSKIFPTLFGIFFGCRCENALCIAACFYSGGGTGRHAGLKILFPATGVTVRFRSRVQRKKGQIVNSNLAFLLCCIASQIDSLFILWQ